MRTAIFICLFLTACAKAPHLSDEVKRCVESTIDMPEDRAARKMEICTLMAELEDLR